MESWGTGGTTPTGSGGGWRPSRFDIHLPDWGWKKMTAVGVLGVTAAWGLFTWDRSPVDVSPIPFTRAKPSSPLEVLAAGSRQITHALESTDGGNDTSTATDSTDADAVIVIDTTTAPETAETTPTVPAEAQATLPTLGPVTSEAPAETPVATVETVATTPQQPPASGEALPNPMQYSPEAGSVVCSGNIITVRIDPNAGPQLSQLRAQTGEGWDESATGGPNPADDALFNEVLRTRYDNGDGTFSVVVRDGCVGLEK